MTDVTADIDAMIAEVAEAADYIRPFICDTIPMLHEAIQKKEEI